MYKRGTFFEKNVIVNVFKSISCEDCKADLEVPQSHNGEIVCKCGHVNKIPDVVKGETDEQTE